jgi:hypothetical protein
VRADAERDLADECLTARCTVTTSQPDATSPLAQECLGRAGVYPSSEAASRTSRHVEDT